ncbi:MAG: tetratricopeptide repeat protein [Polyangiales bacterium]
MPANPGKSRTAEKQKKKRAAAQQLRQEAQKKARARAAAQAKEQAESPPPSDLGPQPFTETGRGNVDYDLLDECNAEIRKLIKNKNLDEAEKKARELAGKFPRYSDGLQRLAEIHEKRGDKDKAIAALKQARTRPNDGDEEVFGDIDEELERLGA